LSGSEPETPKPDSAVAQEVSNELGYLKAENKKLVQDLKEARSQLAAVQAENESLRLELEEARSQLATLADERDELQLQLATLAQLKKEVKEDAAELHREGRAMEIEKARWQRELSDARDELADAKATMLKQGNKIRELERGYSLKPNPEESRLRLEIGDLQAELEAYKQQQPAIDLSDKAGEVASYVKTLLCDEKLLNNTLTKIKRNKPIQLPRDVISEVEKILGGGDG